MSTGRSQGKSRRASKKTAGVWRDRLARWFAWFFASLLLGSLCAGAALFAWSLTDGAVVGPGSQTSHIEVRSRNKWVVIDDLAAQGLLSSPLLTKMYATVLAPTATFEPRAHLITHGISARELVARLAELGSRPRRRVMFPEGFTHLKMAKRLEQAGICSALGFRSAVRDPALLGELKLAQTAEGYLFPESYEFSVDSDPRHVVRRMVSEARRRFEEIKRAHPPHPDLARVGMTDEQVVTLASIVEKETSRPSEAPRVARVFLNRLLHPQAETRGRLQSDPTAIYGCMVEPTAAPSCLHFEKTVTPEMLSDARNAYNTYRHAGLPPGPISNPGERSLTAVLRPAEGSELYFVADGTGAHTFSETYPDHLRAIEALRLRNRSPKND